MLDSPLADYVGKWGLMIIYFAFLSVFIFNYYNIDKIWCWVIFIYVAIYSVVFFISLLNFEIKEKIFSEEQQKNATLNIVKCIILYLSLDAFYISIVYNQIIVTTVFGVFSIILILIGLINAFLNTNNTNKELLFWEIIEMVIGLGLTVYLIFIIPDSNLQQIVMVIIGAVYSGIFTLVGVAWTFKKSDEVRQCDMERLDFERREEERKKFVPYITISNNKASISLNAYIRCGLNLGSKKDVDKIKNNTVYLYSIKNFNIKNVSESNIIIKAIIINDHKYDFENYLIEKCSVCEIKTTDNYSILLDENVHSVKMIVSDILMNEYYINCSFSAEHYGYGKDVTDNGEEYNMIRLEYTITNISMPEFIEYN